MQAANVCASCSDVPAVVEEAALPLVACLEHGAHVRLVLLFLSCWRPWPGGAPVSWP
jgi:hypothetical protein